MVFHLDVAIMHKPSEMLSKPLTELMRRLTVTVVNYLKFHSTFTFVVVTNMKSRMLFDLVTAKVLSFIPKSNNIITATPFDLWFLFFYTYTPPISFFQFVTESCLSIINTDLKILTHDVFIVSSRSLIHA